MLLLTALISALASAEEPEVPDWAQDWKKTYLAARAQGSLQMTGAVSTKVLGPGSQELFAVLELSTVDFPPGEPSPAAVAVVIDRSASTAGSRLFIAKKATLEILAGLTERDRLSLIRVSETIQSLPAMPVTAANREKMKAYVEETRAEGRSDLSAGLEAALKALSTLPDGDFYRQVILLSDGQPTDGMVDAAGLAEVARELRDSKSVHVSTVAIGEDADLELMAGMAKEGWGFAARLNDSSGAARVAQRQHLELVRRAADKTSLRVTLEPGVRVLDVIGHDSSREDDTLRISLGELGPGEVLPVVLHLAVSATGKQARPMNLAHVELQYENALTERTRLQNLTLRAEFSPQKPRGTGVMDPEATRQAARVLLERNLGRAEELAVDTDRAGAKQLLEQTRATLKRLSSQAPFDATRELAQLNERAAELSRKYALNKQSPPTAKKSKKRKR